MPNDLGFFSYAHDNDDADGGRVAQLGRDIAKEYSAITGDDFSKIFIDRDSLHLGDDWKDAIDDAIQNVPFFIPVLTPWFFRRVECRRELQYFIETTEKLGLSAMILPILYIDIPELHQENPSDVLIVKIKRIQWEPWGEIRYAERNSREYRMGLNRIAQELVRRNSILQKVDIAEAASNFEAQVTQQVMAVESKPTDATVEIALVGEVPVTTVSPPTTREARIDELPTEAEVDGVPTELELLGAMEDAFPRLTEVLDDMAKEMVEYSEALVQGTREIEIANSEGRGFATRLRIARKISEAISGPVDRIGALGQKFASDLYQIDLGFKILLPRLVEEAKEDKEILNQVCQYFRNVRVLADASLAGAGSTSSLIDSIRPLENISKDLRPPIRKLMDTLTAMYEVQGITNNWITMMDNTGIDYLAVEE